MQEKRTPVFQTEDGSWGHSTKMVNAFTCTIEYGRRNGFASKEEAEESYHQSMDSYQRQISKLKKERNMPFTFSEYLDHWIQEVYPLLSHSSAQLRNQWVIDLIIKPHLHKDILLGCIDSSYLNKVLESCQAYCTNGGYYAYRLLHAALKSACQNSYIPEINFQDIRHYPEPAGKVTFYSDEQLRKFLVAASHSNIYLEIQLALFCGLRKGEILGLRYADFRKYASTVTIQRIYTIQRKDEEHYQTKKLSGSRQNRTLKIPSFIFQELAKRRKENRRFLSKYPNETKGASYICLGPTARIKSDSTFNTALKQISLDAGLPQISIGDLRYMFARFLAQQNFSIESISSALGHTKLNTTIAFCGRFPADESKVSSVIENSLDPIFQAEKH